MHADHTLIQTAAHILVAITFISIGTMNYFRRQDVVKEMRGFGVPQPEFVLPLGLATQCIGGLMLLLDFYAGLGALVLIVFTITASCIFQRWWKIKDNPFRRIHLVIGILTNFSVIAALLLLFELNGLAR